MNRSLAQWFKLLPFLEDESEFDCLPFLAHFVSAVLASAGDLPATKFGYHTVREVARFAIQVGLTTPLKEQLVLSAKGLAS
jgi:hypothetical protein